MNTIEKLEKIIEIANEISELEADMESLVESVDMDMFKGTFYNMPGYYWDHGAGKWYEIREEAKRLLKVRG